MCKWGIVWSRASKNRKPPHTPTKAGKNASFPRWEERSSAGSSRLHTDAATMTPAAKPDMPFLAAPFSSIGAYLDRNAAIYQSVKSVDVAWVRPHTYKITEQKAEEFYKYADGVYSCHVSLKLTMMQSGQPDFDEFIDLTLYLHKVNGKYLIYELKLN